MKRFFRFLFRLPFRLLAFNLLLVFLPVAGVLFLGQYEARLETAEVRDLTHQARLVAAAIARGGTLDADTFEDVIRRAQINDVRMRLIDSTGRVVADSQHVVAPAPHRPPRTDRHNMLYRIGAWLVRPIVRWLRPPEQPLEIDFYANAQRLTGNEIATVLRGREVFDKKITADSSAPKFVQSQPSVTHYRMVPVVVAGWTVGAVVASKSTYTILQDLYVIRLRVMRIFLASIAVAILVGILFTATVVRPIRQLRVDARAVLDRRNRMRGHFKGSRRGDEIGELSRALERIMRRLDAHVALVEKFAADVVHELKNPLASIRNANEMLADVADPNDRRRFVRVIEQEVARMERLLTGVREISIIDSRLVKEDVHVVDLGALLSMIADGFRVRERDRVKFDLEIGPGPLTVRASEDRLTQVFENILDNAASFSPNGSTVSVRVQSENGSIVTRISDEGPGIPAANLNRIFDRFFTHRPEGARVAVGHTGLGLAIVRAIVEAYGGSVAAENAERGAIFTVSLPRRQ
jgi:two-component system, OmpR family, sensor histidine kinase ChvG